MGGDMSWPVMAIMWATSVFFVGTVGGAIFFFTAKFLVGAPVTFWSGVMAATIGFVAAGFFAVTFSMLAVRYQFEPEITRPVGFAGAFLLASLCNWWLVRKLDRGPITFAEAARLQLGPSALLALYLLTYSPLPPT